MGMWRTCERNGHKITRYQERDRRARQGVVMRTVSQCMTCGKKWKD